GAWVMGGGAGGAPSLLTAVWRAPTAVLEQSSCCEVRRGLPRARGQGRRALHERRHAGGRLIRGVADARGGGDGDQEPRRQGAGPVAQKEPGPDDRRGLLLPRAQQPPAGTVQRPA